MRENTVRKTRENYMFEYHEQLQGRLAETIEIVKYKATFKNMSMLSSVASNANEVVNVSNLGISKKSVARYLNEVLKTRKCPQDIFNQIEPLGLSLQHCEVDKLIMSCIERHNSCIKYGWSKFRSAEEEISTAIFCAKRGGSPDVINTLQNVCLDCDRIIRITREHATVIEADVSPILRQFLNPKKDLIERAYSVKEMVIKNILEAVSLIPSEVMVDKLVELLLFSKESPMWRHNCFMVAGIVELGASIEMIRRIISWFEDYGYGHLREVDKLKHFLNSKKC